MMSRMHKSSTETDVDAQPQFRTVRDRKMVSYAARINTGGISMRIQLYTAILCAAVVGIAVGTHFDSLYVGIAGAAAGAAAARLATLGWNKWRA